MSENPLRLLFPCFSELGEWQNLVYLDSAATTQKPQCVIDAIADYYRTGNANVHRSTYRLAEAATTRFEEARKQVQQFINAEFSHEIIFTKGCTESINLVAAGLAQGNFSPGDRILVSASEHHANFVPWQQLAKRSQLHLDIVPVDAKGCWQTEQGLALIGERTRMVALGHVSNATGNLNPIEEFITKAKAVGALTLIDGAQAVAHINCDVQALDCDFYAFSGHKVYGPTGIGVLYGKTAALNRLPVYQTGGEMVQKVTVEETEFQPLPFRFEAGTPNIEGAIALASALAFMNENRFKIADHEEKLKAALLAGLSAMSSVVILGDLNTKIATVSFWVEGIHGHDLASWFDRHRVALRVGSHCAMPLMHELGVEGTVRVSLACYNTEDEVAQFLSLLERAVKELRDSDSPTVAPIQQSHHIWALQVKDAKGWDGKYRQIMLAGKQLGNTIPSWCAEEFEVQGCESKVWLKAQTGPVGLVFDYYSNGKIVRGLLTLLIEPIQNRTADFILAFDFKAYLADLGIEQVLSESRANGVNSVIKRIRQLADHFALK